MCGCALILSSVPDFPLMADREHGYKIRAHVVSGNVAAIAEVDHQFAELGRQIQNGPADAGLLDQYLQLSFDGLGGALCGHRILGLQKFAQAHQIRPCVERKNQSWHSGAASSLSPFPQESSQAKASSPVMCKPVS